MNLIKHFKTKDRVCGGRSYFPWRNTKRLTEHGRHTESRNARNKARTFNHKSSYPCHYDTIKFKQRYESTTPLDISNENIKLKLYKEPPSFYTL